MSKLGQPGHGYTFLLSFFLGGTAVQSLMFLALTGLYAVYFESAVPTQEAYARLSYLEKNLTTFCITAVLLAGTVVLGLLFRGRRDKVIRGFSTIIYTSRNAAHAVLALFFLGLLGALAYYHTPTIRLWPCWQRSGS